MSDLEIISQIKWRIEDTRKKDLADLEDAEKKNKGKRFVDDYKDSQVLAYAKAVRLIGDAFTRASDADHKAGAAIETLRPVHGTPFGVRLEYRRDLDILNQQGYGAGSDRPAVHAWMADLRERVAESKDNSQTLEALRTLRAGDHQLGTPILG